MGSRDDDLTQVARLAVVWSRMTEESDFLLTPDHCINGTRIAKEVLAHFGVKSRPVSVGCALFNRFAYELFINGVPAPDWPEHAWSVGVHPDAPNTDTGWNGHLMLEGEGWTLDVSAQQFHRPGLILVPNALWFTENVKPEGEQSIFVDARQQVMVVWRTPYNTRWRQASGWRLTRPNQQLIVTCINRMQAEADREEPDDGHDGHDGDGGSAPADLDGGHGGGPGSGDHRADPGPAE